MKLSSPLAKRIAEEMMNVIPYNINVMDENGTIIGSGDRKRIGTFHNGALKAIKTGRVNEVYEEGDGMRPGVNQPIVMDGAIIGVVGITGHPDEVRPFSRLLKVTVVLLIEQEAQNKRKQEERMWREKFFHELSYRKTAYDQEFIDRGKEYGLDLSRKCRAILVQGTLNSADFIRVFQGYSNYWNLENDKTVFFSTDPLRSKDLLDKLEHLQGILRIGLGQAEEVAANSLDQALSVLGISAKIYPERIINRYEELKFLVQLSHADPKEAGSLLNALHQNGDKVGLIETLQAYIAENGDHNQTVKRLRIHRNTLNYRLNRIKQLTGKDPRSLVELFELLCGLMWRD